METYSSILAWKIPWTEEPGGLQYMGLQRLSTHAHNITFKTTYSLGFPSYSSDFGCNNTAQQSQNLSSMKKTLFYFSLTVLKVGCGLVVLGWAQPGQTSGSALQNFSKGSFIECNVFLKFNHVVACISNSELIIFKNTYRSSIY